MASGSSSRDLVERGFLGRALILYTHGDFVVAVHDQAVVAEAGAPHLHRRERRHRITE